MDEYFVKRTDERLDRIERKVDTLLQFKWQIISGAAAVSAVVGILLQIALAAWK